MWAAVRHKRGHESTSSLALNGRLSPLSIAQAPGWRHGKDAGLTPASSGPVLLPELPEELPTEVPAASTSPEEAAASLPAPAPFVSSSSAPVRPPHAAPHRTQTTPKTLAARNELTVPGYHDPKGCAFARAQMKKRSGGH
jgi:hypothetical protein